MAKKDSNKKKEDSKDDGLVEIVFDNEKLNLPDHLNNVYGIPCERNGEKLVGRCAKDVRDAMKDAGKCE